MNETNTANLSRVQELLRQNIVYYYAIKTVRLIFEIGSYLMALILFIVTLQIPNDPYKFTKQISDTTTVDIVVHDKEVTAVILIIKAFIICFSISLVILGLALGAIRRKNNRIKKAAELVDVMLKNNILS